MPESTIKSSQLFWEWVHQFAAAHPGAPVDGEYYDLPETVVYMTHKLPLGGKGRLEIHIVTPEARPHFQWEVEITIDDLDNGVYKHILLQTGDKIVETYGKQVHEVDHETATELLNLIHDAEASAA
jgi:hypothetical protein